jgi:hypothetical protein
MCAICGLQVYPEGAGNVLTTVNGGDTVCHEPYWIVYQQATRNGPKTAKGTFFSRVLKQTAAQRAKAFAATRPDYHAKQIKPHGHQQKR